jgi:hypothetical protein
MDFENIVLSEKYPSQDGRKEKINSQYIYKCM